MAIGIQPITINSLSGGLNDTDPATSLKPDECTIAENVEFFFTPMGERRSGCVPIGLPTSVSGNALIEATTWMGVHYPSNALNATELWALSQNLTTNDNVLTRNVAGVWSTVSPTLDALTVTSGQGAGIRATSLHKKFFVTYKSAVDRAHVWDGSVLRRTGVASPSNAPVGADTGAGAFASTRYYRVRYTEMSGSTVLRRSEPSPVLTFTPSGAGTGVIVTRPALVSEGETHWELEASTDNANFYRIATTVIGTTTTTDSTAFATGYASVGILSEALTSYSLIPSGKFVTTDGDRLIMGGSYENSAYASRIWWTPVLGATGVGNDERLDMTVNPFIDLDGFEGGELTGLSRSVNGYYYAFKWQSIYKIIRQGNLTNAYSAIPVSKARGAMPGSLIEAVDQSGSAALYFLDPLVGPMRIGKYGLEWLGGSLRTLWSRVNQNATIVCHGVHYPFKNQVHFWLAVDGSNHPNFKIVLQCNQVQSDANGGHRGWSTVPVGNRMSDAYCSTMFSQNVDSMDSRSFYQIPFIGKGKWTVAGVTKKDLIQRCDIGGTDALTAGDSSAYYYARIQTRPYSPSTVLNKVGIMAGTLVVGAITNPTNDVHVQVVKDFGLETKTVGVVLFPVSDETVLIRALDNLSFSEVRALQMTFGDLDTNILPITNWQLHLFSMKIRGEQTA